MLGIISNVDHITFDIEYAIEQQIGTQTLPFPGMDKSNAAVCTFFQHNSCAKGYMCPFRHVRGEKQIVCKHWLRGLCKKGDECEFLHQYDMTKMPECFFFSRFGMCNNKDCPFLHIDPDSKIKDCPWYDRGFCKHGPTCKNRHVRRVMCQNYLNGFCLDGLQCKFQHPKFDMNLPSSVDYKEILKKLICHYCGQPGHKVMQCPSNPNADHKAPPAKGIQVLGAKDTNIKGTTYRAGIPNTPYGQHDEHKHQMKPYHPRNMDHIKCYRCGKNGHIASHCQAEDKPSSHLLSSNFPS
ncbi:putative cleavage and polyadenylation specificity factor subunit 4-like [Apostichopus japonicus]|uniref:Cleavage and polyadenylation specificity factor subunit 4 n=1 Tax=Stichopus japonicus TaxID=307972 RepID=A0A2G8KV19_STIJA|nr:putative cleavage and polyadenylation specificity factor subunit 4-like [Apostichopus japonicus]